MTAAAAVSEEAYCPSWAAAAAAASSAAAAAAVEALYIFSRCPQPLLQYVYQAVAVAAAAAASAAAAAAAEGQVHAIQEELVLQPAVMAEMTALAELETMAVEAVGAGGTLEGDILLIPEVMHQLQM